MLSVAPRYTIDQFNAFEREEFVRLLGPVFEHSPWIAEATWPRRPFKNLEDLHRALCATVEHATDEQKLSLIRAHPDLVERAATRGSLTSHSAAEQASAGLDQLLPAEITQFEAYNHAYRQKFGFPFVICARLNKKTAILSAFPVRLGHSRDQELRTALHEISKIAYL